MGVNKQKSAAFFDLLEKSPSPKKNQPQTMTEWVKENFERLERALTQKNHTYESLTLLMKKEGIKISSRTLKQYMYEVRQERFILSELESSEEESENKLEEKSEEESVGALEVESVEKSVEKSVAASVIPSRKKDSSQNTKKGEVTLSKPSGRDKKKDQSIEESKTSITPIKEKVPSQSAIEASSSEEDFQMGLQIGVSNSDKNVQAQSLTEIYEGYKNVPSQSSREASMVAKPEIPRLLTKPGQQEDLSKFFS